MSHIAEILHYRTLVFDCDGVILNSNGVKTRAFYDAARSYGESAAKSLVDYHVANGGISRYRKFEHFLREIVGTVPGDEAKQALLDTFSTEVRRGLLSCDVAPRICELRRATLEARWLVVSGGDQVELRAIFAERGLDPLFDGGIFGSPDNKGQILGRELARGNIQYPALFLGDSRYDYQAADAAGLDFIFISAWTEVRDWQAFVSLERIPAAGMIDDLNPR